MDDAERPATRRRYLKRVGVVTALGLGGVGLLQNDSIRDRVVKWSKGFVEPLRKVPGLGYSGRSVKLADFKGSETVLQAERDEPGFWRGAPALEYDRANDRLLTHVRHRDPIDRGKRVSIYQVNRDSLAATELVSLSKRELDARSVEGGEIVREAGEYRWVISYQDAETGKWGLHERRASTLDGLRSSGRDIEIRSSYHHHKDPAVVNGEWYVLSNSRRWLDSGVERVDIDAERPTATEINVTGYGNARITAGGVVGSEVFADVWPDFPGTGIANVLWTSDERSTSGVVDGMRLQIDPTSHYVSASGTSVTYVDAIAVDGTVTMLWQAEMPDGSNDLVGTQLSIDEYEQFFVDPVMGL